MLPEKIYWNDTFQSWTWLNYDNPLPDAPVLDTELLHLCWLVEETLSDIAMEEYGITLTVHATWQQRIIALAKVKGIETQSPHPTGWQTKRKI